VQLVKLHFLPDRLVNVTQNLTIAYPAAYPLVRDQVPPPPEHLPAMHIAVPHHCPLSGLIQQACQFAVSQDYQPLFRNCSMFADFIVRLLTGGAVRSAPLIFDLVTGQAPVHDSPLTCAGLAHFGQSWFPFCDGTALMEQLLEQHPGMGPQLQQLQLLPLPAPLALAAADELSSSGSEGSDCSSRSAWPAACCTGRRSVSFKAAADAAAAAAGTAAAAYDAAAGAAAGPVEVGELHRLGSAVAA